MTAAAAKPGLTLRPYQEDAVTAVLRALTQRSIKRPLVVLPTGTGKTAMFSALIARRGGSAIVLAHRDELLRQAAEKIKIADPTLALGVGMVANRSDDTNAPVVVASVQTLARESRLRRLPRYFDTVVVDEAHHAAAASYRRVLAHLEPSPLILGVTATPTRADGKALGDSFQEVVYRREILEMIEGGYLADVRGVRVGLDANLDKVKQSGGDFDAEALGEALEEASAPLHVLAAYREHAPGRKAVVFAPTVALAHRMAGAFANAGIPAEPLDGKTPADERQQILERLQTGKTRVLANVAVCTEGIDLPSVDCIVMAAPTKSQVRYAQSVGRGLRPFPGKRDCLVIDVCGVTELELQTLPRLFSLSKQPAPDVSVIAAIKAEKLQRREIEERRKAEREKAERAHQASGKETVPDGELRSQPVSMLEARRRRGPRRLRWLRHKECWLVSVGRLGTLALVPNGQRWQILKLEGNGHECLAADLSLADAHAIADDLVRSVGAHALASPYARWRNQSMSARQAGRLRRLGVAPPDGATKGAAADLITVLQAAPLLDRLVQRAA